MYPSDLERVSHFNEFTPQQLDAQLLRMITEGECIVSIGGGRVPWTDAWTDAQVQDFLVARKEPMLIAGLTILGVKNYTYLKGLIETAVSQPAVGDSRRTVVYIEDKDERSIEQLNKDFSICGS